MPPSIQALDDLTIARIAAGEVVERPASIVKELIENSLDAGARNIEVEIKEGGRRLIQITDDGAGIAAGEIALAFEKHATSKIRSAEDLITVASLGFRGEALASIASVSHVTALSRAEGAEQGMRIRIDNGRQLSLEPAGAPKGTRITVENLFNAVPARLKFLKQATTEAGYIQDMVIRHALAHPDRRISLVRDGRRAFQSPGSGDLSDALAAQLGAVVAAELLAVSGEREDPDDPLGRVRVSGYVSPPHVHRTQRKHMTLLVNGRWVQDRQLSFAVQQAYHGLLPKGRFPLGVLKIELPAEAVDVNVHPAKTELRFRNSRPVFSTLQRAVRSALLDQAPVAPLGRPEFGSAASLRARDARRPADEAQATGSGRLEGTADWAAARRREANDASPDGHAPKLPASRGSVSDRQPDDSGPPPELAEPKPVYAADSAATPGLPAQADLLADSGQSLPMLRPIGQLATAFVLAEGPEGLYIIDQHAAHERIMFERMQARARSAEVDQSSQVLLSAETIALPPRLVGLVEERGQAFARAGFDIEAFGADAVILRALPEPLAGQSDLLSLVRDILEAVEEGDSPLAEAFEEQLLRVVCKRASVKAGQRLSHAEMRGLIRDLEACEAPRTCPHGRPTVIAIDHARIEREFGRS